MWLVYWSLVVHSSTDARPSQLSDTSHYSILALHIVSTPFLLELHTRTWLGQDCAAGKGLFSFSSFFVSSYVAASCISPYVCASHLVDNRHCNILCCHSLCTQSLPLVHKGKNPALIPLNYSKYLKYIGLRAYIIIDKISLLQ